MNKKNMEILMGVLIVIAIFLGVYYIIDKNSPKKVDYNSDIENTIVMDDLVLFPEMDSSVKVLTFSYDGVTCEEEEYSNCSEVDLLLNNKLNYSLYGFKIEFTCLNYFIDKDDSEYRYCEKNRIKLDNKVTYTFNNSLEYEDLRTLVLKTDKYYIIKQINTIYGQGNLKIYDLNGKEVKSLKNSIVEFDIFPEGNDEEMESKVYVPVVNDNKLYYVYSDYLNFENGLDNKVHLGYVDLNNNFKYTEISSIKAVATLGI